MMLALSILFVLFALVVVFLVFFRTRRPVSWVPPIMHSHAREIARRQRQLAKGQIYVN